MIFHKELREALAVIDRMLDALQKGIPTRGTAGVELRRVIGNFQAHEIELVEKFTIGTELFACFEQARLAGATLDTLKGVRLAMMAEQPVFDFGKCAKLTGMVFSFVEQCTLISKMTFVSRFDVEAMITRMNDVIESLKLEVAELLDGMDYQAMTMLAATLIHHLAATERRLPQIVGYVMPTIRTSLSLANYLYGDGARSDELIMENKIIHPAFFTRNIRALSR
jgi:hypothetical protein